MLKKLISFIISLPLGVFALSATQPATVSEWATQSDGSMLASANFMNMDRLIPLAPAGFNEEDENQQLINDLLDEASRHIGTRYVRGGKTPRGFDCSGFTGYVYRQFGYQLGASSRDQYREGIEVPTNEIMPGDLLFFKGRSARSVGHVGIAVDANPETGEITFIHAATSGGIRMDHVSAPYYSKRFLGARRIITL